MGWQSVPYRRERNENAQPQTKKMRFLLDESVNKQVNTDYGKKCDMKLVSEMGLQGRPDEDVYVAACKEDRVILTCDKDFLNDHLYPLKGCPGVIALPMSNNLDDILRAMDLVLVWYWPDREWWRETKIIFGSNGEIRVRFLCKHHGKEEHKFNWDGHHLLEWFD